MKRALAFFLLLALLLGGCAEKPVSAEGFALDTILRVTLYDGEESLALSALALADEMEARLSCHRAGTEISELNQSGSAALSKETADLLRRCLSVYAQSGGALDIGLGAVSTLWDFTAETPTLPDEDALADALAHAGADKLSLSGNTARLADPNMQVDLGAAAKGELADNMAAYLRENGCRSFLLNLGGSLYASGGKNGAPFVFGIEDPRKAGSLLGTLRLTDGAVATSSSAQRGFTLNGVRYHHILDPKTGWPAQAGVLSATVVCENGLDADLLSTACYVLGAEGAKALLTKHYPNAAAILLLDDGTIETIGQADFVPASQS